MSNFTSKLMDIDASLVLLLPSLDQDCFQFTKEHCFHSEITTKTLPQASKQNFIIHFVYSLSPGFCFFTLSLSWTVFLSLLRVWVYVFGADKLFFSLLTQFEFAHTEFVFEFSKTL